MILTRCISSTCHGSGLMHHVWKVRPQKTSTLCVCARGTWTGVGLAEHKTRQQHTVFDPWEATLSKMLRPHFSHISQSPELPELPFSFAR